MLRTSLRHYIQDGYRLVTSWSLKYRNKLKHKHEQYLNTDSGLCVLKFLLSYLGTTPVIHILVLLVQNLKAAFLWKVRCMYWVLDCYSIEFDFDQVYEVSKKPLNMLLLPFLLYFCPLIKTLRSRYDIYLFWGPLFLTGIFKTSIRIRTWQR